MEDLITYQDLLINEEVQEYIREYPGQNRLNLSLMGEKEMPASLHFCYYHLEHYPNLLAELRMRDYRYQFVSNASIYLAFQTQIYSYECESASEAAEMARHEVSLLYQALNEKRISGKAKCYLGMEI